VSGPDVLSGEDVEALLALVPDGTLVAVSGGPDSTALMGLLAGRPGRVVAATVDHGLRPEAAAEARAVAELAERLGIEHHVLTWTGPHPETGIQEAAREARYRVLCDLAERLRLEAIATAHTLDDQAETVLMRLAHGTGIAGLAAMHPVSLREGLLHVRPFLNTPKAALVELCRERGWSYLEDPSNEDERFARVRWRRLMPALAEEGLTADRLGMLADRARRAEEALLFFADGMLGDARIRANVYEAAAFAEVPFEVALRMLIAACREVADPNTPERLERFESALVDLLLAIEARRAHAFTVAGTIVRLGRSGEVSVAREGVRRRGRKGIVDQDDASPGRSLGKGPGGA
jgi:tRNA(Ile)-lysidine synthase